MIGDGSRATDHTGMSVSIAATGMSASIAAIVVTVGAALACIVAAAAGVRDEDALHRRNGGGDFAD